VINARAVVVAGLVGGLTALAVLSAIQSPAKPRPSPGTPGPSGSPSPSGPPTVGLATTAAYEDGSFGASLTHKPTAESAQSKLWFNDGTWWATLVDPSNGDLRIARLDWPTQQWQDTGTLVDERVAVRADTLWDGAHLTIVTAGPRPTAGQAARLIRFHYDAKVRRYIVDPDFPITLVATGVEVPMIARDSKGVLWLSYVTGGSAVVRHTVGDDYHWVAEPPTAIPGVAENVLQASLISYGGRVAFAWSTSSDDTLKVAIHKDGDPDTTWSSSSTIVTGLRYGTDQLALHAYNAAAGWRLFVALGTGQDPTTKSSPLAPAVVLMVLEPDGSWTNVQVARNKDNLVHPVVVLDLDDQLLYVVAATSNTGQIVYKRSHLDPIAFEAGVGDPLIASPVDAAVGNPSTTKQDVDGTSGLVVLAADDTSGRYLHGAVAIGSLTLSPARLGDAGPGASPPPPPPPASVVNIIAHDTFDPWAIGSSNPEGWVATSEGGGKGTLSVVAGPSAVDRVLRLLATSSVGSLRACLSTPVSAGGVVTVTELVRLSRSGSSDSTIGSIRGPGGEAASVRVTRHNLLGYFNGSTKVTSTVAFRPGTWYRSTIVVNLRTRTYNWTLTPVGGRAVINVKGLHWRTPALTSIDSVCIQTASKSAGQAIFLNDVVVER
jgi:hypothetical protein